MKFIILLLGIVTLWDGATTVLGTISIIGNEPSQVTASIAFAAIITVLLLCTSQIFNTNGVVFLILIVMWLAALIYDFRTSYYGNEIFILSNSANSEQGIIIFGMSFLVTGAPILISFIINNDI